MKTTLPLNSPRHKHLFLTDLEWLVIPALMTRQFQLWRRNGRPVGFASWATVSDEVEQRMKSGMPKLRPDEWQSGDRAWLVDMVAPFGNADRLLADLKQRSFKDRALMALRPAPTGKGVVAVGVGAREEGAKNQK